MAPDLVIFSWVFLYLLIVEEFQTTMIALTVAKLPEAHLPQAHLPEAHLPGAHFPASGQVIRSSIALQPAGSSPESSSTLPCLPASRQLLVSLLHTPWSSSQQAAPHKPPPHSMVFQPAGSSSEAFQPAGSSSETSSTLHGLPASRQLLRSLLHTPRSSSQQAVPQTNSAHSMTFQPAGSFQPVSRSPESSP